MLPITATQFGMNRLLEQTVRQASGREDLGNLGRIAVAMGAGVCSAPFGCAAEFVMIQQQKSGRTLPTEFSHVLGTHGPAKLLKGLVRARPLACPAVRSPPKPTHPPALARARHCPLRPQSATVMRESLYAAGYLGVCPLLREYFEARPGGIVGSVPGGALVVSSVAAGLLATVTTQPADTIKTRMQVRVVVGWG